MLATELDPGDVEAYGWVLHGHVSTHVICRMDYEQHKRNIGDVPSKGLKMAATFSGNSTVFQEMFRRVTGCASGLTCLQRSGYTSVSGCADRRRLFRRVNSELHKRSTCDVTPKRVKMTRAFADSNVQVVRLASKGHGTLLCVTALAKVRWTATSAFVQFWTSQLVHTQQRPACLLTSAVEIATAMLAVQEVLIFDKCL